MEGEIKQRWMKGFNNDGERDSTTMEVGIRQRWNKEFNSDGRSGGSHKETAVKLANKGSIVIDAQG